MKLQYCCVSCPRIKELTYIIDNSKQVTLSTFKKHVDRDDFKELTSNLGYGKWLPISNDWHISYHKSKTPKGRTVYYMCHSAIEYVFY